MRVSEDLQSGEAVLCMPRDLFKEGGHSRTLVFAGGSQEPPEDEDTRSSQKIAMQGLRIFLPGAVPSHQHHHTNSTQVFSAMTGTQWSTAPHDSTCSVLRDKGSTGSSSAISANGGISLSAHPREWSFQAVASLRANPNSLSSDVIAAIDFDETGTLFASGGIARKIRVCSYTALLRDHQQSEALQTERVESSDSKERLEEKRQLLGSHGRGRSCRSSKLQCGVKRKDPEREDVCIQNHDESALRIICSPAKLSSLKWRAFGANVIGCGDYDGVVTEWDVEQGLCLCERYEHSGQRIWSVDYSSWFPTLCASASGDGTVRLWTLNCERSVGVIRSPGRNSICCAEFSSDGPHRVAVACADSNVYVYDVRRLETSLLCLKGHERAASYVRFLGGEELVSASIDSSVKLWDLSSSNALCMRQGHTTSQRTDFATGSRSSPLECEMKRRSFGGKDEIHRLRRTFNTHRNVKNFVGLSVWKESGLIACGSESNEVFVYAKGRNEPIWRMKFHEGSSADQRRRQRRMQEEDMEEEEEEEEGGRRAEEKKCFVGAVCWRKQDDHHSLLTANSQGTLQLVKVA